MGNLQPFMEDHLFILLVEDEPDQALLVRDALKEDNGFTLLPAVPSGEEAIAYLSGDGRFGVAAVQLEDVLG